MRRRLFCLLAAPMMLAAANSDRAAEAPHPVDRAWAARQQAAAGEMIAKLDMTSFANSIGPRREPGKHTLAQYGFTTLSSFDDGWAYAKMPDDSWEIGVLVLNDGVRTRRLCVTDTAVGGGTYRTTTAIDVAPRADGSWGSTRVLSGVPGCR